MDSVLCGGPNSGVAEPGREPGTQIEQKTGPQTVRFRGARFSVVKVDLAGFQHGQPLSLDRGGCLEKTAGVGLFCLFRRVGRSDRIPLIVKERF
jgi:hypothetical protein